MAPLENFADEFRARLAPWMNPHMSVYAGGLGQAFEQIYDLVIDQGTDGDPGYVPGWGVLFDVTKCPTAFLPYLGQFVGVGNLIGVDDATARALIQAQVAMHRGTPRSIVSSAMATLTGTQHVVLTERYLGDPYHIQVITFTAETPSQAATLAAILAVKPAGIVLTYSVFDGWIISAMETFFTGDTITFVEGDFTTITDYESKV